MGLRSNIKPTQKLSAITHWRCNVRAMDQNCFLGMRFVEKAINDEFLKIRMVSYRVASYLDTMPSFSHKIIMKRLAIQIFTPSLFLNFSIGIFKHKSW